MDSIVKSLKKLDDSMLRNLICTVELVTYSNIIKGAGGNIASKFQKKTKNDLMESQTQNLLIELNRLDNEALFKRLTKSIEEKLRDDNQISNTIIDTSTLDAAILESACKGYKISLDKPYLEKIDLIKQKFEFELKKVSKKYQEMGSADLQKMELALDNLSEQEVQDLKKQLNIEELNAQAIKDILTRTGGSLTLMMIPSLAGFSSYIFLTTMIHAIFTTLLGITLPFAFYTSATSLVSLLSGPVGWIGISGATLYQLRKHKHKLTQTIMGQIVGVTALYNETTEERINSLPNWLSKKQKSQLFSLKSELDKAHQELGKLNSDHKKSVREISEYQKKVNKLLNEVATLNEAINNLKQSEGENTAELKQILNEKLSEIEEYRLKEEEAMKIVNLGNSSNIQVRSLITSISKVLHSVNYNDRKGNEGEHIVYVRLLETLPAESYALLEPQIGEKYPDIIVIHPKKGFRIVEVKNHSLNSISHIESNGLLNHGHYNKKSNPLGQARLHSEELFSYLTSNYPNLGNMYRSIGHCVVHTGFTKDEFVNKFRHLINNWDDIQTENFFKYHIFNDQLYDFKINERIWGATKFKNEIVYIPEKVIVEIAMSMNIDPYFENQE